MDYKKFNLICLGLFVFFVSGTVFVWSRNEPQIYNTQIPQLSILEIKQDNQNRERVGVKGLGEIADETLPAQMNLAVPFTSQAPEKNWEEPWQDACEEAAVLMLDAYYKSYGLSPLSAKDELLKMVAWEKEQGLGPSISMENVKKLVDSYILEKSEILNLKSEIIADPTVEQIKNYLANGQPVLAVADGKVLPNPHFRNGGPVYHALIIKGYDEDEFITNDPGTQFGADFRYKYDVLMNAIHDWNSGDVKNGRRVVLVLE
ncbi:MAG: C39 family peptidase [Patescibacteria group bacterium]